MIFARRAIQQWLIDLDRLVGAEAAAKLVRQLNLHSPSALGFEWEAALLYALSRIGRVQYEAITTGKRPDIAFAAASSTSTDFVADVTCVSDRGLDDDNPVEVLHEFIIERAQRAGLNPDGFDVRIEGDPIGETFRDRKMKLALPVRRDLRMYLDRELAPVLALHAKQRSERFVWRSPQPEIRIALSYDSRRQSFSSSHPSYQAAYSASKNPVFSALKAKATQLRSAGSSGAKGIFLCDGGCHLLRAQVLGVENFSADQIIKRFLRASRTVSFVATIWVDDSRDLYGHWRKTLRTKLATNKHLDRRVECLLANFLDELPSALPTPVRNAQNASVALRGSKQDFNDGVPFHGGWQVQIGPRGGEVRISARQLMELLAGRETQKSFFSSTGFLPATADATSGGIRNPFETALAYGLMISNIAVEHQSAEDDDWITFRFSGPDAAVWPFQI